MREVSYDGIPFSVEEERIMDCQHSDKYFNKIPTSNNPKPKRLRLQGTRKIGCQAKIHIKKYTLYPEFAVSRERCKSKHELKANMQQSLSQTVSNKQP